ncbi:DUF3794 domain-containing protein [Ruminococcus sp. NK3A76]|uniref:DUF3794 domain-containing protein n=1 Tax=Ruminococcus sp. NK3A76 TaxID=877411 RepID=UPI000490CED0|nr:DUF3794 domain-containing protein [Ruminococcus sp. NK3A76]
MQVSELRQNSISLENLVSIFDEGVEQLVEKDFVLPDYCPDIFRVLKCRCCPRVLSYSLVGKKLSFELSVTLKLIYESEGSARLGFTEQKLQYSKSVELPQEAKDAFVRLTPSCDYVDPRVVNKRRIDVRGAVTTKVSIMTGEQISVISDCTGAGIELRTRSIACPAKRIALDKRLTIVEEFELGEGKPQPAAIIRSDCAVIKGEQKTVQGKLVLKGDAEVTVLYSTAENEKEGFDTIRFTVPFSRIIDADGIDDSFDVCSEISCASCEIMPKSDSAGTLECEIVLLAEISAVKQMTAVAAEDAYSTKFETEVTAGDVRVEGIPLMIDKSVSKTASVRSADEQISKVYDCWGELNGLNTHFDDDKNSCTLLGNIRLCMLGQSDSGKPLYLEHEEPFEAPLDGGECVLAQSRVYVNAFVRSTSFRLTESDSAELTAQICITGHISECRTYKLLTSVSVDTDRPKQKQSGCAVKLCRCDENTDIWDIAKKYSTSASAIEQENDLAEMTAGKGTMLLVPLI